MALDGITLVLLHGANFTTGKLMTQHIRSNLSDSNALLSNRSVAAILALLDLVACTAYWWPRGETPGRILAGAAAWMPGGHTVDAPYSWILGGGVIYLVCLAIASGYASLVRHRPVLAQHQLWGGAIYGIAVYGVLHLMVLPLLLGRPIPELASDWQLALMAIHVGLIGVPAALLVGLRARGTTHAGAVAQEAKAIGPTDLDWKWHQAGITEI